MTIARPRHESVFRTALALTCATGALALGSPAFAQDTAPADPAAQAAEDIGNAEIVVTAQFREQRLQDTPIAITAVNAEMLESRSQNNIAQVADQAPNVILKPQGASFGPSIAASIRGIGQADFNPAYEPGVGIYVDDVYYPQLTGAVFDLLDLDRVEVLRGPQGTLAGKNSIGGAIKLYSKKPTGDGSGSIEGTFGSRQRIEFRGSADFTIAKDLFGRISGVTKQQDGYVDRIDYGCANPGSGIASTRAAGDCKISELGGIGYTAVRGMLRYAPAGGVEINLIADYTKDDRTIPGEVVLAANLNNPNTNPAPGIPYDNRFYCGRYCNYLTTGQPAAPFPPFGNVVATQGTDKSHYEGYGFSGQINVPLGDTLSLVSISSYRNFKSTFDSDDDISPANIGFGQNKVNHWNWSQELRLNGKVGDNIDFTVGGYYFKEKTTYFSFQDIRYAAIPLQFVQDDPVKADTKAVFANANIEVLTGLNVSGGVRYTKETKDYTFFRNNPDGTPNLFLGTLNGATGNYSGDKVDYRANIDYRFSPELLVYANVATGFKGGGINPRPFNPAQVLPFNPETLTNFEIGFKSDLFDRKLRVNVAAFYSDYKDIQIPLLSCPQFGGPGPCALPANAGDGKFKGFEIELYARPVEGLQIDGALSYLDFHYVKGSINPAAGGPSNPAGPQEGDPFANAPKWKYSFGIQYKAELGGAYGSLTPRFDISFQDDLYAGHAPPAVPGTVGALQFLPSYTLGNARLTWRNADEDLEASLAVTNLFEKYYFLTAFDLRNAGAGLWKGQPGRPREWSLTIKKKF